MVNPYQNNAYFVEKHCINMQKMKPRDVISNPKTKILSYLPLLVLADMLCRVRNTPLFTITLDYHILEIQVLS